MDIEKLISIVQGYPVLYNTSDPDYMRAKLKDEIWGKIGTELQCEGKFINITLHFYVSTSIQYFPLSTHLLCHSTEPYTLLKHFLNLSLI